MKLKMGDYVRSKEGIGRVVETRVIYTRRGVWKSYGVQSIDKKHSWNSMEGQLVRISRSQMLVEVL